MQSLDRWLARFRGPSMVIGMVRYIDYQTERIPESNYLAPALHKMKSFAHENEMRAVYVDFPHLHHVAKHGADPGDTGRWVRVDLAQLLEHVVVCPDAPKWIKDLVKSVLKKYDLDETLVVTSPLAKRPLY